MPSYCDKIMIPFNNIEENDRGLKPQLLCGSYLIFIGAVGCFSYLVYSFPQFISNLP